MATKETKLPDQADIVAANEKLTADLAAASVQITTLTAERDAATSAMNAAGENLKASKLETAAKETEIADLKAKLATSEAAQAAFDLKVATKVVELGFTKASPSTAAKTEIIPGEKAADSVKPGRERIITAWEDTGATMAKFIPGLARN